MAGFDDCPPGAGAPLFSACLKAEPADFVVNEVLGFELAGSGEHLYLNVQKTRANTDEIARLLESVYAVTSKDVGLSGMKDRQAVTSQWFSVVTPLNHDLLEHAFADFNTDYKQATLLRANRHSRKLRRGAHTGNNFQITLRDVQPASGNPDELRAALEKRITYIREQGFPNYIGPQRFGIGGQNLVRARQWFRQPKKRTSRQQRSLWLSAGRSALFNAVCAARVVDGSWQELLVGEPAMLHGTHSFFDSTAAEPGELATRLQSLDIHPSAPWWGRGNTLAALDCAQYEHEILSTHAEICTGLEHAGLSQERRALRAVVENLMYRWHNDTVLELSFHLPPGVFATTLLAELGRCQEPVRPQHND